MQYGEQAVSRDIWESPWQGKGPTEEGIFGGRESS